MAEVIIMLNILEQLVQFSGTAKELNINITWLLFIPLSIINLMVWKKAFFPRK